MKDKTMLGGTILAVALSVMACGKAPTTASSTSNANSSKTNTNVTSTAKKAEAPKPKTDIQGSKKPEAGTAKEVPAAKKVPVPSNWVYMYDQVKGYGFYLPEGSKGDSSTAEGINVFAASTPAPAEVGVIVLAYKNQTLTKQDLLDDAVKFLEGLDQKVQAGTLSAESEDYSLADATTVDADGKKAKLRILVGTDVTDNYVMIVGTEEAKFDANKEIIDAIWGSFEMWSGGASGNN